MKYAILSTDNASEYYSLIPLACYSWKKIGYIPVVVTVNLPPQVLRALMKYCPGAEFIPVSAVEGVKDSTVSQVARLFVANEFYPDDVLITSDADMVIAKDFFAEGEVVSHGWDLTGRGDIPMCYVKATAAAWVDLMKIDPGKSINENIKNNLPERAYSDTWEQYWESDQKLLTQRAKEYGLDKITFVDRGHDSVHNDGLPVGRWDRHRWRKVPNIFDIHMKRNSWEAQGEVFRELWPEDDYSWIEKLKEEL